MVKYSRMEENKRVYEEQYDTDEYEALTCECHHLARAKELNGSRRKPFFCIYCKSMYKDKNKLNLHRLEGCFAVTNDGRKTVLKIYPMFGKGQRGEIEDILIKRGLMSPRKKPSRAKRKKAAVAAAAAALRESGTSIMDFETSMQEELTPLRRPQKLKVRGMLSSSIATVVAAAGAEPPQKKPHHLSSSESVMQISYGHHDEPVVDRRPNGRGSSAFVVGRVSEMQVQMQLTREQVEAQAWEVAEAWEVSMLPDAYHVTLSPPFVVPCPGLCHLMRFQLLPSDFPDVREESFLQAFFEFVDNGNIDSGLRSSYGTWYMERETDADEAEQSAVKLTMSRFKLVQGRPDLTARHKEKSAVQTFLHFQKESALYEAHKEAAMKELQSRRERYVKEKLEAFDARVQAQKEVAVWNWSPLLHILKTDAITGVPSGPWSHSDAEHKKIAQAVVLNRTLVVRDSPRCPLVVRLFKIVYLYCFEKNSTLSDPVTGLLRDTMLGYSASESAAPVLRISAQSVLNEGCFLFADLPPYSEAQAEVFQDINALLHGTAGEREEVVQKVQEYLKVVRQRAVGDMAQLHPRDFHVLWCGGSERQIADALKRFMACLKSREDLDMGWVAFPAVMLAREAVLKAIHKLHDQRVLSDKTRLLAASAAAATNEKFQALVETCVVQKSQVTDSAANGSLEGPEDDSKPSSHSTTSGSAETTKDSRSSPDMKETGTMDVVEKPHRFNSSPDLNLSLDSNPETESPETTTTAATTTTTTTHIPSLNAVNPVKTVSVLGVAVQTSTSSDRPPFPLRFYGPGSDVQSALRLPDASSDPTALEYSRRVPLLFSPTATTHKDDSSITSTGRLNLDKEP